MLLHSPFFGKEIARLNLLFSFRGGCDGEGLVVENKSFWVHLRSKMYYHPLSCEASPVPQLCWCSSGASMSVTVAKAPVIVGCSSHHSHPLQVLLPPLLPECWMDWGGRLRSFRLGGIFGSCRPNPYGIVGSLVSESIVTICGSGDAMDEIDMISRVAMPEISVELETISVFGRGRLASLNKVQQKIHQSQSSWLTYWRPSWNFYKC